MKDRLCQIYQQYAEKPFRDGNMLVNIHNDLFPREEQDRRLLKLLLMVKGNTQLLDVRQKSLGEQSVAITRLEKQMEIDLGLQSAVARNVITSFWLAIGGNPDALTLPEDRVPERTPAPNPAPAPIPAPPSAPVQQTQRKPVCRMLDYRIQGDRFGKYVYLSKYVGNDSFIQIPDKVTHIGRNAFVTRGFLDRWITSSHVKEILFPWSLERVCAGAFWRCKYLEKITFCSSSIRGLSIEEKAFGYCTALHTVEIPDSVYSIAKNAFVGCRGITVIASDKWKREHPDLLSYIEHPPKA